jgi:hypothetical protein
MKTALNPRSSEKLQYEGRESDRQQCGWRYRKVNVEAQATCIKASETEVVGGWMDGWMDDP